MKNVLVSLMAMKAEVKFDPAYVLPSQIANKVCELGFNATVMESQTEGQGAVDLNVSPGTLFLGYFCLENKRQSVPKENIAFITTT